MKKWQSNSLFRFLSSLKLAVISILTLASVLAVATVLESLYGMRGAHVLVYGRIWFFAVLGLLATNVFCAALSRYPWKRHQIGFLVTHTGILILLFGSWLTMRFGVDGNLPVVEGSSDSQVILNDLELILGDADVGRKQAFPIRDTAVQSEGRIAEVVLPGGDKLVASRFFPRARVERVFEPSPLGMGVPALNVEIYNERFSLDEWLVAEDPDSARRVNLGPAVLAFQKLWDTDQERLFLAGKLESLFSGGTKGEMLVQLKGKEYRIDVDEGLRTWKPLGDSGLSLKVSRYLPYAVVEKNKLVNRGDTPTNPAVELLLRNAAGQQEQHVLFSNFPDFATRHTLPGEKPKADFGAKLRLNAANVRGRLFFGQSADNKRLLYRITGKNGDVLSQGLIAEGEEKPTGWMDLRFKIARWVPSALVYEKPKYVEKVQGSENFASAVEVVREKSSGALTPERWWLVEGSSAGVHVGDRLLELGYARERLTLPFAIHLEKFQMGTDPGTTKAATYESDVQVKDPANADAPKAHISMNEPLHYGGYTFYQASYQLRDGQPPLSVFSVNYDPGRMVKYAGSLTMVLGILLMFLMNPHYWDIVLGRKR